MLPSAAHDDLLLRAPTYSKLKELCRRGPPSSLLFPQFVLVLSTAFLDHTTDAFKRKRAIADDPSQDLEEKYNAQTQELEAKYNAKLQLAFPEDHSEQLAVASNRLSLKPKHRHRQHTPTFQLGKYTPSWSSLSDARCSFTSTSSKRFASVLFDASPSNLTGLLTFLHETSDYFPKEMDPCSPPSSVVAAVSGVLTALKVYRHLYLSDFDAAPLLPDLALLLAVQPSNADPTTRTLSCGSFFALLKRLQGRHQDVNPEEHEVMQQHPASFYLGRPAPEVHLSWCITFGQILKSKYPKTHAMLDAADALSPEALSPIFERFFVPLLPTDSCRKILAFFILEGGKALFRFGVGLVALFKRQIKAALIENYGDVAGVGRRGEKRRPSTATFHIWNTVRDLARDSEVYSFSRLLAVTYGPLGSMLRSFTGFIPREKLVNLLAANEQPGREAVEEFHKKNGDHMSDEDRGLARPLDLMMAEQDLAVAQAGLFSHTNWGGGHQSSRRGIVLNGEEADAAKKFHDDATRLGGREAIRHQFAKWVPPSLRTTKMKLLFSSDVHGRDVEILYRRCASSGPSILLIEVVETGEIVGMFASHAWARSMSMYGAGSCFIFSMHPEAHVYRWSKSHPAESFMFATGTLMGMGGNADGTAGLQIAADLVTGSSNKCGTFHNANSLVSTPRGEFNIGTIEVYGLTYGF